MERSVIDLFAFHIFFLFDLLKIVFRFFISFLFIYLDKVPYTLYAFESHEHRPINSESPLNVPKVKFQISSNIIQIDIIIYFVVSMCPRSLCLCLCGRQCVINRAQNDHNSFMFTISSMH